MRFHYETSHTLPDKSSHLLATVTEYKFLDKPFNIHICKELCTHHLQCMRQ